MVALTYNGVSVQIAHGMSVEEEVGRAAVGQQRWRSVTGRSIVQDSPLLYGVPVHLRSPACWVSRSLLETLHSWQVPGAVLSIQLPQRPLMWVRWDVEAGPIVAEPLQRYLIDPRADTLYQLSALRFITTPMPE